MSARNNTLTDTVIISSGDSCDVIICFALQPSRIATLGFASLAMTVKHPARLPRGFQPLAMTLFCHPEQSGIAAKSKDLAYNDLTATAIRRKKMQLDQEKIKKCTNIGSKLDFPAQIVMLVFLLGAGITSIIEAFNQFSLTLYFVLVSIFICGALAGLILYLIGGHNRNYVNRQIFAYCENITDGAIDGWCSGDALSLDIALSKDPDTAVFTVTDGRNAPAVYDLTCSLKSGTSAAIFIASCVCRTAARIKSEIGDGKKYKKVSYRVSAGEGASAEQYFVKDGKPDEKELNIAAKQYEKVCKKCKK